MESWITIEGKLFKKLFPTHNNSFAPSSNISISWAPKTHPIILYLTQSFNFYFTSEISSDTDINKNNIPKSI